jgi:exopolysaccharide biosynthesis polyprenyl glycosylphosphotransferase
MTDVTTDRISADSLTPAARDLGTLAVRRTAPDLDAVRARQWPAQYVMALLVGDAMCAALAVQLTWTLHIAVPADVTRGKFLLMGAALVVGWLLCLQGVDGYEVKRISFGAREYQRVLRAGINLAAMVAIVGYLGGLTLGKAFVAVGIPFGILFMLVARWWARRSVYERRENGTWTSAILAVGTSDAVLHVVEELNRSPQAGLVAVGACVEDGVVGSELAPGVPILGDTGSAAEVAERMDVDVVAVAGAGLGPARIRELAWALEGTPRQMVMAPGLTGVAGPRVHVSPVEGLSLMWVDPPRFSGFGQLVKRVLDIVGSSVMLLLTAPLLLVIASAIRLTSKGPALFKQKRLGKGGEWVTVLKFRTMYQDAEHRRDDLLHLNESSDPLFFKMRDDPRITPFGRLLRRLSLDELPQLFNIFGGSMSLVGPRPLPGELDLYTDHFRRRMMVKPGLTGLWQVSGRSDLTAEDAVRLDLYYVENWSLSLDLAIIARTVWAVVRSRGAY